MNLYVEYATQGCVVVSSIPTTDHMIYKLLLALHWRELMESVVYGWMELSEELQTFSTNLTYPWNEDFRIWWLGSVLRK